MPDTIIDQDFAADAIAEIRETIGTLALLHAGDRITPADMRAAVTAILANCDVLDVVAVQPVVADIVTLPICSLDDVVRRNAMRVGLQGARP